MHNLNEDINWKNVCKVKKAGLLLKYVKNRNEGLLADSTDVFMLEKYREEGLRKFGYKCVLDRLSETARAYALWHADHGHELSEEDIDSVLLEQAFAQIRSKTKRNNLQKGTAHA